MPWIVPDDAVLGCEVFDFGMSHEWTYAVAYDETCDEFCAWLSTCFGMESPFQHNRASFATCEQAKSWAEEQLRSRADDLLDQSQRIIKALQEAGS